MMNKAKEVVKHIILTFCVGVCVINLYNLVKHVDSVLEEK